MNKDYVNVSDADLVRSNSQDNMMMCSMRGCDCMVMQMSGACFAMVTNLITEHMIG